MEDLYFCYIHIMAHLRIADISSPVMVYPTPINLVFVSLPWETNVFHCSWFLLVIPLGDFDKVEEPQKAEVKHIF